MSNRPLLQPGRNCWTIAPTEAAGLVVDAEHYFRAFYEAAQEARRYILLAGWRFNSDVRLLHGSAAEKTNRPVKLLPFLHDLCARRPDLRIYVLAWDFSINYALEWEWFQRRKFERGSDRRLQFRFDGAHPVGGSDHLKLTVLDGRVAFVGGLDFSADAWDRRCHPAYDPDRADSGTKPHAPHHDMMAWVAGPAAQELARYFAENWNAACGETLEFPDLPATWSPPFRSDVRLPARPVALSRTQARTLTNGDSVKEIRQLYLDAIAAAEQLIYMENQYFSSWAIHRALLDRMRAPGRSKLDIVLVLPRQLPSWVEAAAMGPPQLTMMEELRRVAEETGHHLGVYYSRTGAHEGQEVGVVIHSKLTAIDDRFLTVGSANASNRSLGMDTELNLAWEAGSEDGELRRSICRVRVNLLAEHSGLRRTSAVRALGRTTGLVGYLNGIAKTGEHRLRSLSLAQVAEERDWLRDLERCGLYLDPQQPLEDGLFEVPKSGSPVRAGFAWLRNKLLAEKPR